MKVKKIEISNFRNIEKLILEPCNKVNVIWGENAQGKTNILEAIWIFCGAKSFRGSKDNELIKKDCDEALISLIFESEEIEKTASIKIKEKREAVLNNNKLKTASALAGKFNSIIFSPQDLRIVTDGPSVRRKFIDTAIAQIYPTYIEILRNYAKAVTERNQIIKNLKYDSTVSIMLDVFEEEIAKYGEKIIYLRKKYINEATSKIKAFYNGISSGKEKIEIFYKASWDKDNLLEALKKSRKEDMNFGFTSVGPHRDDIEFLINSMQARSYASQGQKRSIALSLKLSEAEIISEKTGEKPVFLLDDVMSELDVSRQDYILNHIKEMQTFITCCDPSNIKNLKAGKVFKIVNGEIA